MPTHDWRRSKQDKLYNIVIVAVLVILYAAAITICVHYFLFPHSSIYFSYLVPEHLFSTNMYISCGLVFVVPVFGVLTQVALIAVHGFSLIFYMQPIIRTELRLGLRQNRYSTQNELREISNLFLVWRSLQCLVLSFTRSIGLFIVPLQMIFMQLSLFAIVMMFLHWKALHVTTKAMLVLVSSIATVGWIIFLRFAAMVFQHTKGTLGSWKLSRFEDKQSIRLYAKKFKRSCKPLSIGTEGFYHVRPVSVLNFLRGLCRGTVRALLSLQKAFNRL